MARNILQLVTSACYRANAQTVPTTLVSPSNAGDRQLLHLVYSVCEELRALRCWPQLKRTFKLRLVAGQERYDLPADFYSLLPFTQYDSANRWPTMGPMTDVAWNFQTQGNDFTGNERAFRLFGYGVGQVQVNPIPAAADASTVISFDYVSKSFLQPPAWTASESVAQNIWRNAGGILYKKLTASSHTTGTLRPSMEFGEGQDGSVRWLAFTPTAFTGVAVWHPGDYFTAGGRLYCVTVGGTSAAAAPTSTTEGVDLTSGTITYRYFAAPAYAAETAFDTGDHILGAGSQYYRCVVGGITGKASEPLWTPTQVNDSTVLWTFQNVAYEEVIGDTDLCVFDEELVIAGLRAKLFQARGLGASDLVETFEKMKRTAMGRWHVGKVIDMADCGEDGVIYPTINWTGGNWTVN